MHRLTNHTIYEGCSERNASYVIMLTHDIRGGCWWYSRRGWSFPYSITFCCCAAGGSRGAVWQKGMWYGSVYVSLNSSLWKKWHPLTFNNTCWVFVETKQWMQWNSGWCISAVLTSMWKTSHVLNGHALLSHHTMNEEHLYQLIHPNQQIMTSELCTELNISFSVLKMMVAMLEYCKVCTRWVPKMLTWEEKEHRMQVCWDLLKQYEAENESFLDHIVTSDETWCQNSSPWSSDVWIPHWRKSSRSSPQQVKWCALSFEIGKGWSLWISWNPGKPSTLASHCVMTSSWMLKLAESDQRGRKPFFCNTIMAEPVPTLRPSYCQCWLDWCTTPSDSPDLAPFDFHLFGPMKDGLWEQSNDGVLAAVKQWVTSVGAGFKSMARRLLLEKRHS